MYDSWMNKDDYIAPVIEDPWYSGVGDFFKDLSSSAVSDLSSGAKSYIQTEINKTLVSPDNSQVSQNDIGRLQYQTDHSNRSGLLPSFALPSGTLPGAPDGIGSMIPKGATTLILITIAGIAGLIAFKKFV